MAELPMYDFYQQGQTYQAPDIIGEHEQRQYRKDQLAQRDEALRIQADKANQYSRPKINTANSAGHIGTNTTVAFDDIVTGSNYTGAELNAISTDMASAGKYWQSRALEVDRDMREKLNSQGGKFDNQQNREYLQKTRDAFKKAFYAPYTDGLGNEGVIVRRDEYERMHPEMVDDLKTLEENNELPSLKRDKNLIIISPELFPELNYDQSKLVNNERVKPVSSKFFEYSKKDPDFYLDEDSSRQYREFNQKRFDDTFDSFVKVLNSQGTYLSDTEKEVAKEDALSSFNTQKTAVRSPERNSKTSYIHNGFSFSQKPSQGEMNLIVAIEEAEKADKFDNNGNITVNVSKLGYSLKKVYGDKEFKSDAKEIVFDKKGNAVEVIFENPSFSPLRGSDAVTFVSDRADSRGVYKERFGEQGVTKQQSTANKENKAKESKKVEKKSGVTNKQDKPKGKAKGETYLEYNKRTGGSFTEWNNS